MKLEEFVYDPDLKVYVPKDGVKEFRYSDGKEVEEYIFDAIFSAKDRSSLSSELNSKIKDWPSRYHLSPLRANLLRPFSLFDRNLKVLEVGSGCGAITRYLGEVCGEVDAIEGSLRRAMITKERCKDLENVKVFVADFFELFFEKEEYHIVTLIGVLEYAPIFFSQIEGKNSCLRLLEICKKALKNDGILIIAIENKLGLKYFTGSKEDHTGILFDSLYDYPSKGAHPVTFSKKELTGLLKEAGFPFIQFYFPFPDYKFPKVIIRDCEELKEGNFYLYNWIPTPFEDYSGSRIFLIHEALVARTLYEAGLLGEFANSFLLFASKKDLSTIEENWIAKKITIERDPSFMTMTTLYEDNGFKVKKERIGDRAFDSKGILSLDPGISEWVEGELLIYEFYRAICNQRDPMNYLVDLTRAWNAYLLERYHTGKYDSEGYPLLSGEAFDCTPWNIIVKGKEWIEVDREWRFYEELSVEHVLFRGLYYLFEKERGFINSNSGLKIRNPEDLTIFLIKDLYPKYNIDRFSKNRIFESHIQDFVTCKIDRISEREIDGSFRSEVFSCLLRLGMPASEASRILKTVAPKLRSSLTN